MGERGVRYGWGNAGGSESRASARVRRMGRWGFVKEKCSTGTHLGNQESGRSRQDESAERGPRGGSQGKRQSGGLHESTIQ